MTPIETALNAATRVCADIEARDIERLRADRRVTPVHTNRASGIDDQCERRLYHHRVNWDKPAPHPDDLLSIFSEGHLHERDVVQRLDLAGHRLLREQVTGLTAGNISGHPEGEIHVADNGSSVRLLAEIKSAAQWTWDKLDTAADVRGGASYVRKWYGQVQVYMRMRELGACVLVLKNKQTGRLKAIPVPYDAEYADALVEKARRIEEAVRTGAPPAFAADPDQCRGCPYFGRVCNPPTYSGDGAQIVLDEDLREAARVWRETRAAAERFDEADKALKKRLRGVPAAVVNGLLVQSTTYPRKEYTVAAQEITKVSINPLGPAEGVGVRTDGEKVRS